MVDTRRAGCFLDINKCRAMLVLAAALLRCDLDVAASGPTVRDLFQSDDGGWLATGCHPD